MTDRKWIPVEPTARAQATLQALQDGEHWQVIRPLWEAARHARVMAHSEQLSESSRAAVADVLEVMVLHLGDLLQHLAPGTDYGQAHRAARRVVHDVDGEV